MGLLRDTLRGWLSPSAEGRLAGRAALAGRMLGRAPVRVTHPSVDEVGWQAWHYPKGGRGGLAPPELAATLSVGLLETRGHELLAWTLGDSRSPDAEPMARVLAAAAPLEPGGVAALPEGTLGRSAHRHVVVVGSPVGLDDGTDQRRDWEAVLGGPIRMVLTLTDPERAFVEEHGVDAIIARVVAQEVAPACDRRAGDVRLGGSA